MPLRQRPCAILTNRSVWLRVARYHRVLDQMRTRTALRPALFCACATWPGQFQLDAMAVVIQMQCRTNLQPDPT